MTLESYLALLDWTGRQLRGGTRGVIPLALASILDRLQVSAESWLETIARFGRQFHRAVGLSESRQAMPVHHRPKSAIAWLTGWPHFACVPGRAGPQLCPRNCVSPELASCYGASQSTMLRLGMWA